MKLLFTNTYVENSISSVQLLRCAQLFATPWTAVCQASLSITNSQSRLKLMSIKSVMPSNHLILCCPLLFPPSSFPASGSFPRSQFFASGGQSMDIHDWFPLGLTCLISLPSKGLSRVFSNTTVQEHHSLVLSFPYSTTFTSIHDTGKTIALTRCTFLGKVMSLLSNVVSRLVMAFLPRSKCLLISWWQLPSAVILEPQNIKSFTVSTVSPSIFHEVMGPDTMILVFWMLNFKPTFSLSSFTFIKRLFSSSLLSTTGWYHLHIWCYWYFSQQSWFQFVLHPAQHFTWCTLHIS